MTDEAECEGFVAQFYKPQKCKMCFRDKAEHREEEQIPLPTSSTNGSNNKTNEQNIQQLTDHDGEESIKVTASSLSMSSNNKTDEKDSESLPTDEVMPSNNKTDEKDSERLPTDEVMSSNNKTDEKDSESLPTDEICTNMLAKIQEGIKEDVEQWDSNNLQEQKKVEVKKEKAEDYYILGEELGKGKFGVVYKCVDKDTNKEYAAKFLKCRAKQKKTILNEIDILNSLHHKLIVDLVAAFEAPRLFVLVFELISGGELFEKLTEEDSISEAEVIFYIRQLVCAVKHFHDNEILHLDLKPENIMLVEKGSTQIKLIDFGLAARADTSGLKVLFGTAEFVSPEVINYDSVSYGADMWAVGVITYLLLSGYTPFEGETNQDTLANVTLGEWDFEVEAFDEVSSEAKDFIKTLIVKNKDKRASCDECLKDPWLKVFKNKRMKKSIRTANLASFMAKRKWKKSLTAIKAANFFSKIVNLGKSEGTDEEEDIEDDSSNLKEDASDLSEQQSQADDPDYDQSKIDKGISV